MCPGGFLLQEQQVLDELSQELSAARSASFPLFCTVTTLDTSDQVTVELPLFIPNSVAVEAVNMLRRECEAPAFSRRTRNA